MFPETLEIKITQRDVQNSEGFDTYTHCPLAIVVKEAMGRLLGECEKPIIEVGLHGFIVNVPGIGIAKYQMSEPFGFDEYEACAKGYVFEAHANVINPYVKQTPFI